MDLQINVLVVVNNCSGCEKSPTNSTLVTLVFTLTYIKINVSLKKILFCHEYVNRIIFLRGKNIKPLATWISFQKASRTAALGMLNMSVSFSLKV